MRVPRSRLLLWLCAVLLAGASPVTADPLDDLARDFWAWRVVVQPSSGDDIPRVERPDGWLHDWSAAAMADRRATHAAFEQRWRALDPSSWPVARQVDYRLMGSAINRVRWELEIAAMWRQNPMFYVQQALGPTFDLLLPPPPFNVARAEALVQRMAHVPTIVEQAKANLTDMRRPYARLGIELLGTMTERLTAYARDIDAVLPPSYRGRMAAPAKAAAAALTDLGAWVAEREASLPVETAIGREHYIWFLREVALVPFSPEELSAMGRQEWERAVAFEALEQRRNAGLPPMTIFPDADAQVAKSARDEAAIRAFLEARDLLTVPGSLKHYWNLLLPPYLAPLAFLGVTVDQTSETRLDENAISYIRVPSDHLPYFYLSTARDPRPIIVHEGVPGHYLQMGMSWMHENPMRRRYYDSGANEGIGFYAEEMMLQAGLWDESPRSREIIYNFARLRALRVEVDVKLATGEFSITDAADYLAKTVPMDYETALDEAASFAATPGQAITYQIGKLQITRMLADARRAQGAQFSLRRFHDFVWKNGNVPLALVRWELLDDRSEVDRLGTLQ